MTPAEPEKQTVGTVTASHKMLTLQALSSSLNVGTQRGAAWAAERLLGALRQPVPPERPRPFAHYRFVDFFQGIWGRGPGGWVLF